MVNPRPRDVRDELGDRLARWADGRATPLVVGLCGAQGSGKSTLATALAAGLRARGIATVVLALDDYYLPRSAREALARSVHPLLATRGVPGTHDVNLLARVLAQVDAGHACLGPRFDKATDDRVPEAQWQRIEASLRVVLFEGWCVGAHAQASAALVEPVNALEREEDPQGTWRRYVNAQMEGPYQRLHARLDRLVLLAVPGMDAVLEWRTQQERELAQARAASGGAATGVMDASQLRRFIAHYERITRHVLSEMPARADAVIDVQPGHVLAWRGQPRG